MKVQSFLPTGLPVRQHSKSHATSFTLGLFLSILLMPSMRSLAQTTPNPAPANPSAANPPAANPADTKTTPPTNQDATKIQFGGRLDDGNTSVTVVGQDGLTFSLYQFDPGYSAVQLANLAQLANQAKSTGSTAAAHCSANDEVHGKQLSINTTSSNGAAAATSTQAKLSGTTPNTFSLPQPLVGGTELCLVEFGTGTGAPAFSEIVTVNDPFDFGRVSAHFTAGSVITNQQTSSNSSTAAEYISLEVDSQLIRAGQRACTKQGGCFSRGLQHKATATQGSPFLPGFSTFFSAQLTSFPVSTKATTTSVTTSTATPTATTSTSLNVLTSQQGAIVEVGAFVPFRTRGWFKRANAFEFGPLATAAFDTILNPSISSGSSNSSAAGSTVVATTGAFSPTYNSWKVGGRLTAGYYPPSSNYMPKPITTFDVTYGPNSNLSSYDCVASTKGGVPTTGTPTACGSGTYANLPNVSRTLVPRLRIAASLSLPTLPIVFGLDANLAQYVLVSKTSNIDYLNKPGNDIRIYFGVRLDIANVMQKLGLGTSSSANSKSTTNTKTQ